MSKNNETIALKFAEKHGFNSVEPYGMFGNAEVFTAISKEESEDMRIGYPSFILVSNENPHFAKPAETFDILGIHPVQEKGYKGESL